MPWEENGHKSSPMLPMCTLPARPAKWLVQSQNCSNFPAWQLYEYIIVYCMHLSTQHLGGPVKIFEESAWPTKYRHWPVSSNFEVVPPWLHLINFRSETGSGDLLMSIINTERIRGINDHLKKYFWPCARPNSITGCPSQSQSPHTDHVGRLTAQRSRPRASHNVWAPRRPLQRWLRCRNGAATLLFGFFYTHWQTTLAQQRSWAAFGCMGPG